eukprot:m.54936 g.54936  ORF g.54936 m.54936 type:complete len:835 (-) comp10960_c0_seq1:3009-5513(-)
MSVVGFDLGYQTSTISSPKGGGIEVLLNEYSQRQTSSCVSFSEKQRELGEAGRLKAVTNFKSTVNCFKHYIGRQFKDADVQASLASNYFRAKEMPDGTVGFTCKCGGEDKDFSAVQITGMLLGKLRETAEMELKTKVTDCVVGVPFYYNDQQRHALAAATKIAGLNCLRLINETAAVALAYGIYKQDLPAEGAKPRTVVFADVGHSQTQLSCCEFVKGKLVVVATSYAMVGGRDFNKLLFEHFAEEFKGKYKIDVKTSPRAAIRLEVECEKVKKLMSANSTPVTLNLECLMDDKDVAGSLKRDDFEVMAKDLLAQIEGAAKTLLDNATAEKQGKFSVAEIDFVEIVGGSVRVPAIKQILKDVFQKDLNTTLNLDEAVARGCALQAAISSPTFRVRDFAVHDKTPYAIDLTWQSVMEDEENNAEVFKENGSSHLTKILSFFRSENFDLDAAYHEPEAIPGNQSHIAKYKVEGVTPSYDGKSQKVKVRVKLDEFGCFRVSEATMVEKLPPQEEEKMDTAEDKASEKEKDEKKDDADKSEPKKEDDKSEKKDEEKKDETGSPAKEQPAKKQKLSKTTTLKVVTTPTGILSEKDIHSLLEVELDLAASDRSERERSNAKNSLEEYIYAMRDKLSTSLNEYIEEADRESFQSQLTKMEDWLYDEGEDELKSAYVERLENLQKLSAPVEERRREAEIRTSAIDKLQAAVVACRKFMDQQANGDEAYKHITPEEMTKVKEQFTKSESFLNTSVPAVQKIKKTENPTIKAAQFESEAQTLEKVYTPVMNKPVPKAEPPKEEKKEEKAEGEKKEGESNESKKEDEKGDNKEEQTETASNMEVD